jgi:hypothetical protein
VKDAATTWALVVGIDEYDTVPHLTGAAADAVAAVDWLRRLGVPDPQILLHAAPCPATKPALDALGMLYGGCTEPEIWTSFEKLWDNSGSRLFVFLSGHGFYEPSGHRVFLTREASQRVMANLGIDWYARLLRGMPYARQFLVMDGCLNLPYSPEERAKFVPGAHAGVAPDPPRDVEQWLCYAAAMNQRALEVDGRGLFVKTLLDTLDLDRPNEFAATIDETTGTILLDLRRAVEDATAPLVADRAAADGRVQSPGIQRLDEGPGVKRVPVVGVAPGATTRVTIDVRPGNAVPDVSRIRLSSDRFRWDLEVPVLPATTVTCPVEAVLPESMPFMARCVVPAGPWTEPQPQTFTTTGGARQVYFDLEPAGEAREVVVNVVDPSGGVVPEMTGDAYDGVAQVLGARGVGFDHHETGPVLHMSAAHADAEGLAREVAQVINQRTPDRLSAVVRGVGAQVSRTTVRVELTFEAMTRLVGLLGGQPVLRIGGATYPPAQLVKSPVVDVEPGVVPVELVLPWGRWSSLVRAVDGEETPLTLPASVGRPPLRVELLGEPGTGDWPARSVALCAGKPTTRSLVRAEPSPLWSGSAWRDADDPPRWRASAVVASESGTYGFPLNDVGALGVVPGERAEPLSSTVSPEWDALVASGRLDGVSPEDAVRLTDQKWVDLLLGLGGAYACYAQGADQYLDVVLRNLAGLDPDLPDVAILAAARDVRLGVTDDANADRLGALALTGGVPVFRWGVTAGALAADHYGLADAAEHLRALEQRLVSTSVWTMWSV